MKRRRERDEKVENQLATAALAEKKNSHYNEAFPWLGCRSKWMKLTFEERFCWIRIMMKWSCSCDAGFRRPREERESAAEWAVRLAVR